MSEDGEIYTLEGQYNLRIMGVTMPMTDQQDLTGVPGVQSVAVSGQVRLLSVCFCVSMGEYIYSCGGGEYNLRITGETMTMTDQQDLTGVPGVQSVAVSGQVRLLSVFVCGEGVGATVYTLEGEYNLRIMGETMTMTDQKDLTGVPEVQSVAVSGQVRLLSVCFCGECGAMVY